MSIGHISPEAAEGGLIALVHDGDEIAIDIPNRSIELLVDEAVQGERRELQLRRDGDSFTPAARERAVSQALRAYAALTTSAARGAVRDLGQLD